METDDTETFASMVVPVVQFGRPSKKRKAYRKRQGELEVVELANKDDMDRDGPQTTPPVPRPAGTTTAGAAVHGQDVAAREKDEDDRSLRGRRDSFSSSENEQADGDLDEDDFAAVAAELARRRRARKAKVRGVTFNSSDVPGSSSSRSLTHKPGSVGGDWDGDDVDDGDMVMDSSGEPLPVGVRFAPQTGLIGKIVNKHMEEYVEAELAKRSNAKLQASVAQNARQPSGADSAGARMGLPDPNSKEGRQQLAMKGKLHEIDLGADVRARNISMTEVATRRLRGNDATENDSGNDDTSKDGRKSHSRHDGSAMPPQHRAGDDIKLDDIVEQFLHENKMDVDVYDLARESTSTIEGRPTDDRVAEQFRREFMEALAQRLRRKRRPLGPPKKPVVRNEEEILRGPKLGGSRNMRSVMREKLLQKQGEERQNMPKYELQLQEQRRRGNRRR